MSRTTDIDLAVAARVRARRRAMGMSQTAIAAELGVSFQQIQKYESGANRISAGRLVAVATVLQTTVADLLAGLDPVTTLAVTVPSQQQQRLIDALNALPDEMRASMTAGFIRTVIAFTAGLDAVEPGKAAAE